MSVRAAGCTWLLFALGISLLWLSGCQHDKSLPTRPLPSYSEVASIYNARTARLGRVWARAVTSFSWKDDQGDSRYEQGEGFFQLLQPSRFALDIGKLGEVALWLGCDESRYWLIDRGKKKVASFGAHEGPGVERLKQVGFPGTPRNLIDLVGVTPLPDQPGTAQRSWTQDGLCRVVVATGYGQLARDIDMASGEPRRVEILDAAGHSRIVATLANYGPVMTEKEGGNFPTIATLITIDDKENDARMKITLEAMSDGIRNARGMKRLAPEVFNFESLCERLGVEEVVDLDAKRTAR